MLDCSVYYVAKAVQAIESTCCGWNYHGMELPTSTPEQNVIQSIFKQV